MATASRQPDVDLAVQTTPAPGPVAVPTPDPLRQVLEENAPGVQFFQAVRLLQKLQPERNPVGSFVTPDSEAARFRAHPSLSFPPSEIYSLEWKKDAPPEVEVNFLGTNAPVGVLPHVYTELLLERMRARDHALRDFLDLFNHRMISFFYRAWEKYRFQFAYERSELDNAAQCLLPLLGLGTKGLQDRQDVPDTALMFYSGLLAHRPHSAAALKQVLEAYFEIPVEVEQFAGRWYRLQPSDQTQLDESEGLSEQLGVGAVVGDEVWEEQSVVRLRLGPLDLDRYLDFLPTGSAYQPLQTLLKFIYHEELDFEVQLVLKGAEAPSVELGREDELAPRLGWVTWAKTRPMDRDAGETVLQLQSS